jgi:ribosome hibernation promoting factor
MRIEIHAPRGLLSQQEHLQFERQLNIALRAFNRHIEVVSFTLRDVNGPRGGPDKRGQVMVHLRRGNPLVVRLTDENTFALAAKLAAAARDSLKSRIRRRRRLAVRNFGRRFGRKLAAYSPPAEQTVSAN